jgi:hypothetical protein
VNVLGRILKEIRRIRTEWMQFYGQSMKPGTHRAPGFI